MMKPQDTDQTINYLKSVVVKASFKGTKPHNLEERLCYLILPEHKIKTETTIYLIENGLAPLPFHNCIAITNEDRFRLITQEILAAYKNSYVENRPLSITRQYKGIFPDNKQTKITIIDSKIGKHII